MTSYSEFVISRADIYHPKRDTEGNTEQEVTSRTYDAYFMLQFVSQV
jgi:hypothetical protein